MDFVIGDRTFLTPKQGSKLGAVEVKNPIQRFALGFDLAIPFIAITNNPSLSFNLSPAGNSRMVFLTYLHAQISFTDSSTGAIYEVLKYHVAIPAFNVYNSDLNNGQSYRISDFDYYPNLLLQEDSSGQINFVVVTYGGSIQQETGIAPAAGDTVAITLNIGYQLIN